MMGVLGSLVDGGVVNSKGFEDNGRAGNNLLQWTSEKNERKLWLPNNIKIGVGSIQHS